MIIYCIILRAATNSYATNIHWIFVRILVLVFDLVAFGNCLIMLCIVKITLFAAFLVQVRRPIL